MNDNLPDLALVERFITLCKKHGIIRASLAGVSVEFAPAGPAAGPDGKKMEALAKALASDALSDEDALFGSAPRPVTDAQIQEMIQRVQGG